MVESRTRTEAPPEEKRQHRRELAQKLNEEAKRKAKRNKNLEEKINARQKNPMLYTSRNGGAFPNPDLTFWKEITYRSSNTKEPGEISAPSSNLNTAFRLIKEVQKKFKQEKLKKEKKKVL
ncbi:splicing associated factor Dre4 [Bulinus truncatus]|nr:splicing associated factor Dre4 [Bulinus truncatus]